MMVATGDNWHQIWAGRNLEGGLQGDLLGALIKAVGFGSGDNYTPDQWSRMVKEFIKMAKITSNDFVLEVGCGSGGFLHVLSEECGCRIVGVDYSQSLILISKKYLNGEFYVMEANEISKDLGEFDVIFSHSVFHYFPSREYGYNVISRSFDLLRDGGALFLLDINDASRETTYHGERAAKLSNKEEYHEKYRNHPHLFFDKDELVDKLTSVGFSQIEFFEHHIKTYKNNPFRFNLCAKRL
jgi:cyclopropane fatty-acyl-phospholipid synthase-like methyltransferase